MIVQDENWNNSWVCKPFSLKKLEKKDGTPIVQKWLFEASLVV